MKARSRSAPGSQARPLPHTVVGRRRSDLQAPGTGVASNEVFHEVLRVVEDGLIFIAGWDRYKQMGRCRIALNFGIAGRYCRKFARQRATVLLRWQHFQPAMRTT